MAMDRTRIQPYLDDYEKVTGKKTERFVCPITRRECELDELIEGHILNDAFVKVSPGGLNPASGGRVKTSHW